MRISFLHKFFICVFMISPLCDAHAFKIHGIVKSGNGLVQTISGAKIYEEYGSDTPVAVSDENGEFTYETGSDAKVTLIARKKGFVKDYKEVYLDTESEDKVSNVVLEMTRFFQPANVKIYAVLGDTDCIINDTINYSGHCVDETNGYTFDDFNDAECVASFVYPSADGGFVIPNFISGESFFYAQYIGGIMFSELPENNVYYYHIPEDIIKFENMITYYEQGYEVGKFLGRYKNISKAEYIDSHVKNRFKLCPRKLKEYSAYRMFHPIKDTDNKHKKNKSKNKNAGTQTVDTEQIKEAEEAYKETKENETSFANRMLGGLSMAATGIGGMELAQGLAEQNADEAAERDMTAYLATFQCKVGDKRYSGGTTGIETDGANQLTSLYQEYVELAADLKERKTALGMKAGIESEVILDKNNTGLYDDVGHGIENGTYASLYRASRGNENDIKKLEEQKNTSANRVKGGAIAAGVGVVGGIVGNIAINGGSKSESKDKKKVKDLSDDEFKKFVSEQESSNKYSDKIRECLSSKMKNNNSLSLQDLVKECTK